MAQTTENIRDLMNMIDELQTQNWALQDSLKEALELHELLDNVQLIKSQNPDDIIIQIRPTGKNDEWVMIFTTTPLEAIKSHRAALQDCLQWLVREFEDKQDE